MQIHTPVMKEGIAKEVYIYVHLTGLFGDRKLMTKQVGINYHLKNMTCFPISFFPLMCLGSWI